MLTTEQVLKGCDTEGFFILLRLSTGTNVSDLEPVFAGGIIRNLWQKLCIKKKQLMLIVGHE